jgi:hypothetical protein
MSDWKEIKESDGSTKCFFNIKTGITTTERPFELGGQPKAASSTQFRPSENEQVASLLRTIDETHQTLHKTSAALMGNVGPTSRQLQSNSNFDSLSK